jgi:hypothetical protein
MIVDAVGRRATKPGATGDPDVIARDRDLHAERPQAGDGAGNPVRFLVAQLAGAADRRDAPGQRGRQAQDRDLVDRGRDGGGIDVGRPELG